MVPEGNNGDHHVTTTHHQVKHEKEEIALVLHTDTIIDPRTVVIHKVNAAVADGAVMGSGRFNCLALLAFLRPKLLKLTSGLVAVA